MSRTAMPGGGIARRPLHVILMADCSGSMLGAPIQALNLAIAEMMQHFVVWERSQGAAQVLIRAIAFADEPRWHIAEPLPVAHVRWAPLTVRKGDRTNMAPAFRMAASVLGSDRLERRAFNPALLLITDGMPTDPGEFDSGLDALMSVRAGRDAMRLAVAIGQAAKTEYLTRFIANPELPVLLASKVGEISDLLKTVTRMVTEPGFLPGPEEGAVDDSDVVV